MSATPPGLPDRFALLIADLCRVLAAHIATNRSAGAWIILGWSRLSCIARRVARLSAQIRAGTVPRLRAGYTLAQPRAPARIPPLRLPRQAGWLVRAVQPTAVYAGHLRQLLAEPEMAAMLAAAPQLARILRPLCRALGVPPPLPPDNPGRRGPDLAATHHARPCPPGQRAPDNSLAAGAPRASGGTRGAEAAPPPSVATA